jgi:surface protein
MKKKRVVIVGGGIGGLSAAHELVERDFDVTVYERNHVLGGKARSIAVPETHEVREQRHREGKGDNKPLPGEHGFRFFPGWYWHLPDTMKRIPYPKTGQSVFENLVAADINLLASTDRDPIKAVLSFPVSWQQVKLVLKLPKEVTDLVPAQDLEFFIRKMVGFLVSCEDRRFAEYESKSWWDFMEADSRSQPFREYLVKAATRTTVAARPEHASAYTIGKMSIQSIVDSVKPGTNTDRVLNGPTNEVWIDPWRVYLQQQGVEFKTGWELDEIIWPELSDTERSKNEIKALRFTRTRDDLKLAEERLNTIRFLRDVQGLKLGIGLRDDQAADWSAEAREALAARSEQVAALQLSERLALLFEDEARRGSTLEGKLGRNIDRGSSAPAFADLIRDVTVPLPTVRTVATWIETIVLDEFIAGDDQLARALDVARAVEADRVGCEADHDRYLNELENVCSTYLATVEKDPTARDKYARAARGALETFRKKKPTALNVVDSLKRMAECLQREHLRRVQAAYWDEKRHCATTAGIQSLQSAVLGYLTTAYRELQREDLRTEVAKADYFVFALPVEQMAYLVDTSPTLQKHDAQADRSQGAGSLGGLVQLSEHVDWMAGIQFYLREKANITPGHIACLDSEWSLTAISQTQFWNDVDLKERGFGDCKSILSVDISSWDTPGNDVDKPAWDCSKQEIAREVWSQLKRSLNRPGQAPLLTDEMLCGGPAFTVQRNFYLDDSIIDRYDRRKQGFFEKFRRVAFDADTLIDRREKADLAVDMPQAFGPRQQINAEPLLVNRPGAWLLRPDATTGIPNMFLAADYVRTYTNLATMEGANEAARRATNAILKVSGSKHAPCEVRWLAEPAEPLRLLDKELWERKQRFEDTYGDIPIRLAGAGVKAAMGAAEKAFEAARGIWNSFRRDT